MGALDGLLAGNTEALGDLPIKKRAMIPGALPHELSIKDIAALYYPDDEEMEEALTKVLIASCKAGRLQYYGDINGWKYQENMPNPYPKVKGYYLMIIYWDGRDTLWVNPEDCLIHRDDFKLYLQSKKQWPVNGLLANWWHESEPQAEALGDDGTGSQDGTEPASTKVNQAKSDNVKFSGLLNIPKKADDWFQVIDDMTRDFLKEYGKIPNETQAWGRLWTSPPDGYKITTSTDKGEDCLLMPGFKPLSKSAFFKRWENYKANKAQ